MPGHIELFRIGLLSWVTWLPAVGAIFILFFNRNRNNGIRWFANMWIGLCFLISIPLVTGLGGRGPGYPGTGWLWVFCGDLGQRGCCLRHRDALTSCITAGERADEGSRTRSR